MTLDAIMGLWGASDPTRRMDTIHRAVYLEVEVNRRLLHTFLRGSAPLDADDAWEYSKLLTCSAMRDYLLVPPDTIGQRFLTLLTTPVSVSLAEDDAEGPHRTFHHLVLSMHQAISTVQALAIAPTGVRTRLKPVERLENIQINLATAHKALRIHLEYGTETP